MSGPLDRLLPPFVAGMDGVAQILDALGAETEALDAAARMACLQLSASTADTRLDLWERELGLMPRKDLDVQSRRGRVLAALGFFGACTPEGLKALFSRMTGGQATYDERPEAYTLYLDTSTPGRVVADLPGAAWAVSKAAPAHILCHVSATGDLASGHSLGHALHGAIELHLESR